MELDCKGLEEYQQCFKATPNTIFHHTDGLTLMPRVKQQRLLVRANKTCAKTCYFEIELVHLAGEIGIGISPPFYPQINAHDRLGIADLSMGYYSDGHVASCSGSRLCIYKPWKTGDIIGCGIFNSNFFVTRNGKFEGICDPNAVAFTGSAHFAVSVNGVDSKLKTNFDVTKTAFSLTDLKKEIRTIRLPPDILNLIFSMALQGQDFPMRTYLSNLLFISKDWYTTLHHPTSHPLWKTLLFEFNPDFKHRQYTQSITDWCGHTASVLSAAHRMYPISVADRIIPATSCGLPEAQYIEECPKVAENNHPTDRYCRQV